MKRRGTIRCCGSYRGAGCSFCTASLPHLPRRPPPLPLHHNNEVIPLLPVSARTGNVDITITNFLEGAVPDYTPSTSPPPITPPMDGSSGGGGASFSYNTTPSSSYSFNNTSSNTNNSSLLHQRSPTQSPPVTDTSLPINLNTKADSFSRSATDRMLSFHDRKAILLDNALRKYIEKFGVNGERDPYLNPATIITTTTTNNTSVTNSS